MIELETKRFGAVHPRIRHIGCRLDRRELAEKLSGYILSALDEGGKAADLCCNESL
jgi:hypothetical protein